MMTARTRPDHRTASARIMPGGLIRLLNQHSVVLIDGAKVKVYGVTRTETGLRFTVQGLTYCYDLAIGDSVTVQIMSDLTGVYVEERVYDDAATFKAFLAYELLALYRRAFGSDVVSRGYGLRNVKRGTDARAGAVT